MPTIATAYDDLYKVRSYNCETGKFDNYYTEDPEEAREVFKKRQEVSDEVYLSVKREGRSRYEQLDEYKFLLDQE